MGSVISHTWEEAGIFAGGMDEDLYPDLAAKAAALMHLLVLNHPFVDGNKRIGVHAAELMIEFNGSSVDAGDEELERLTLDVATGQVSPEALAIWFRQRLSPKSGD